MHYRDLKAKKNLISLDTGQQQRKSEKNGVNSIKGDLKSGSDVLLFTTLHKRMDLWTEVKSLANWFLTHFVIGC